ncbi:AAA family ATPase [candidate division KSB1 bacterium]|nr:AAA family ATPase [candidate division KSB1 bacterium]
MQTLFSVDKAKSNADVVPLQKRIIAVAGGKGGVGKTVLTASMGIALAKLDYKTVVIDVDLGGANLHQAFGILSPPKTVREFVTKKAVNLSDLSLETSVPNLNLIAGSAGTLGLANLQYNLKQKILRHIKKINADFIILDLGAGNCFNQLDYFNCADLGVVVVTPEPFAIQDSYNFLKLCLYRRLYRSFSHHPQIVSLFKNVLRQPDASIPPVSVLMKSIKKYSDLVAQQFKEAIAQFKPALIVNMLETQDDYQECLALEIAAQEILNIDFAYVDYIRYDDTIRRAMKRMRPDLLMASDCRGANDIRRAVNHLFFGKCEPTIDFIRHSGKQGVEKMIQENHDIICSVKCALWNKCSAQSGGYPCRIKAVGYVNQK